MESVQKPRPNLGEIAYQEIKEMILTGELEPGERIVLGNLSQLLNLSITPIRDALNKLAQEDLVIITPRTSHMVVKICEQDARDIIDLRLTLETFALTSSGSSLADFPVDAFRAVFSEQGAHINHKQFLKADTLFHESILAISPNKRLPKLYSYLQNLIQVLSVQAIKVEGRMGSANDEHFAILDAIEEGDITKVEQSLSYHFKQMRQALLKVID